MYIVLYCETFCFQARLIDIHDVKPLYESKIFKSNNYVYDAHRKMVVQTVPAAATPENQNETDSDTYTCQTEEASHSIINESPKHVLKTGNLYFEFVDLDVHF